MPLRDRTIANFFIGGCGRIIADFLRELLQIPKFQFIYLNPWSGSWELEMEMEMGVGVGWGGVRDWTIVVLWIVPVSLCNRVR